MRWARGLLNTLGTGRLPNGWSTHSYEGGSLEPTKFTADAMDQQFKLFRRLEDTIVGQRALLDSYDPQRRCGVIFDEWGVWDQIPPDQMSATLHNLETAGYEPYLALDVASEPPLFDERFRQDPAVRTEQIGRVRVVNFYRFVSAR